MNKYPGLTSLDKYRGRVGLYELFFQIERKGPNFDLKSQKRALKGPYEARFSRKVMLFLAVLNFLFVCI